MSDFLVDLGANRRARNVIKKLGLPVPLPEKLRRGEGPWPARPLEDREVAVGGAPAGELHTVIAHTLAATGASTLLVGLEEAASGFAEAAEAFARPYRGVDRVPDDTQVHALLFDASGIASVDDLKTLYGFFHRNIGRLARSGRVVVLSRVPAEQRTPAAACAQRAIEGFVRSLAKELGARGSTANLLRVADGGDSRIEAPLRWFLGPWSAFVTAQALTVSRSVQWAVEASFERPLDQKNVLVTGAARGIGAATARRIADEGARVFVLDRPEDADAAATLARTIGGIPVAVDITTPEAATTLISLAEEHGGFDAVVHNAGVTRDKTLKRMDEERWDLTLDVNLGAVLRLIAALGEGHMNENARIVLLSSVAGIAGNFGQTNYAASKAGLLGLLEVAAPRLAASGVALNAVAPGFIETRMTAAIPAATREGARRLSALSQGGQPVDVAEAITFLCTPGAAAFSGQLMRVCGGALIGA
ncbi:MAG: 3-oxoacyl-ACP reductase [Myxococcota bacterium]|nr:3-oxoacyl-ACP reductase [Myxococcota bacterium]